MSNTIYFFDSWGGLWAVCGADDDGAEAFGPRGCARRIDDPAQAGYEMRDDESGYGAAVRQGLDDEDGWRYVRRDA